MQSNQPQGVGATVSDYARKLGQALLGKGTSQDATAQTQQAYKAYAIQMQEIGQQPLSFAAWVQAQQMR